MLLPGVFAEKPFHGFFKKNLGGIGTQISNSPDREALISLLSRSPLYFGQDSGITHLAAMHGIPTIALFKNSSVSQWKPIGPAVRVIEDKLDLTDLIRETLEKADNLLKETVDTQYSGVSRRRLPTCGGPAMAGQGIQESE